jgi:hypothetical protein
MMMNTITNQRTITNWTPYLATSIAEGTYIPLKHFTEDTDMVLEAWAYIGQTGLYTQLQGMFGRTLHALIQGGVLTEDFTPVWDEWDTVHEF